MSYIWIETEAEHGRRFPNAPKPWTIDGWEGEGPYHKRTGVRLPRTQRAELCAPMVVSDTPDYYSVVSDRWVSGRADRREDLKRTGCIEMDRDYGRGMPRKPHKRPLLNKAFAERNGKGHLFDKDRAQDAQRAQAAITADIDKNLYGKGL